MKHFKLAIMAFLASFALLAAPMAVTAEVNVNPALCQGVNATEGDASDPICDDPNAESNIKNIIYTIIDVFSFVVGAVSVIMIIIGGLRYVTSAGDPGNVTSAKNTILYAIVGLIIVIFAQTIVKWVIDLVTGTAA